MFTSLFNHLPQQIQLRSNTLWAGIGLDPVFVFFGIVWACVYLIGLFLLVQIHEKIVKRRKKALETYTFTADTVVYEIQKWIYNTTIDSTHGDWIKNRDHTQNYTSLYDQFQEYAAKISPELSNSVDTTYKRYSDIKRRENILGSILVIVTIWAYKVFW